MYFQMEYGSTYLKLWVELFVSEDLTQAATTSNRKVTTWKKVNQNGSNKKNKIWIIFYGITPPPNNCCFIIVLQYSGRKFPQSDFDKLCKSLKAK